MPAVRIIGAGIGGLTATIALHRSRFPVTLFERTAEFAPLGAGIVLATNAIHLLSGLGVDVRSVGYPLKKIRIRDTHGRTIQETDLTRIPTTREGALAFDRADLHKVLANALPASVLHLGHAFPSADSTASDEILLGADGIYSAVRASVFGSVPIRYSGYTCWRGICANPGITEAFEDWGGATRIGVVPLTRDRIYVFLVKTCAAGLPRETKLNAIRDHFAQFANPVPAALDALQETVLLHHDLEELDRPLWGRANTVLIGDAAHAMTPNLGQGAGMAIEDAVVLPQVIAASDPAAALAKLRDARVSQIQRSSRWLGKLAHWESPVWCSVRNSLLRAVPKALNDRSYEQLIESGMKLGDLP